MAKYRGARPWRRTWIARYTATDGTRRRAVHTSAHARYDLAIAPARSPHAWPSIIWHVDAPPFANSRTGKVS
jgi:hypothetical protein